MSALTDDELQPWADEPDDQWLGSGCGHERRQESWSMLAAPACRETLHCRSLAEN